MQEVQSEKRMKKCLNHIAQIVAEDPDVKDIQRVEVIKEGEFLHVEVVAEVDPYSNSCIRR